MDKKPDFPAMELELVDDNSVSSGRITFYVDCRTKRSQGDRRQCRDRRHAIRFTKDRRSTVNRRQTSLSWNNGYRINGGSPPPL